jgi:hypothetical protein
MLLLKVDVSLQDCTQKTTCEYFFSSLNIYQLINISNNVVDNNYVHLLGREATITSQNSFRQMLSSCETEVIKDEGNQTEHRSLYC